MHLPSTRQRADSLRPSGWSGARTNGGHVDAGQREGRARSDLNPEEYFDAG